MPAVVLDPIPDEITALQERRAALGQDRRDEIWEGVLHMVPSPSGEHAVIAQQLAVLLDSPARAAGLTASAEFNLGDSAADFRVPDLGLHRGTPRGVWHPTAALVVEILSPGDETISKLPFYAAHHVDEVLIVAADERAVRWLALTDGEYQPVERSAVIDLCAATLTAQIDWP